LTFGYANGNPATFTDPAGKFVPLVILGGIIVWEAITIHREVTHPGETVGVASRNAHAAIQTHFEDQGQQTAKMSGSPAWGSAVATGGQFATGVFFGLPNTLVNLGTQPIETAKEVGRGVKEGAVGCGRSFTTTGDQQLLNVGKCSGFVGGTIAAAVGLKETGDAWAQRGLRGVMEPDPDAWSPLNPGNEVPNPLGSFQDPVLPPGIKTAGGAAGAAAAVDAAAADMPPAKVVNPPNTSKPPQLRDAKGRFAADPLTDPLSSRGPLVGEGLPPNPYTMRIDPRVPGRPDPRFSVDTATFPGGVPTSNGGLRDAGEFWRRWAQLVPNSLSKSNRFLIDNFSRLKVSPRVDAEWIKTFPEHAGFEHDVLVHHHVDFGRFAVPVPGRTHVGSGGPFHAR
jgi:hypothetical protein